MRDWSAWGALRSEVMSQMEGASLDCGFLRQRLLISALSPMLCKVNSSTAGSSFEWAPK